MDEILERPTAIPTGRSSGASRVPKDRGKKRIYFIQRSRRHGASLPWIGFPSVSRGNQDSGRSACLQQQTPNGIRPLGQATQSSGTAPSIPKLRKGSTIPPGPAVLHSRQTRKVARRPTEGPGAPMLLPSTLGFAGKPARALSSITFKNLCSLARKSSRWALGDSDFTFPRLMTHAFPWPQGKFREPPWGHSQPRALGGALSRSAIEDVEDIQSPRTSTKRWLLRLRIPQGFLGIKAGRPLAVSSEKSQLKAQSENVRLKLDGLS